MTAKTQTRIWRARLERDMPEDFNPPEEPLWPPAFDPTPAHTLYHDPERNTLVFEIFLEREPDKDERALLTKTAADFLGIAIDPLFFAPLKERDWVRENQKSLGAIAAGRFFIHGSHFDGQIAPGKIPLLIDATLAFGTSYHETTRCCLRALDGLVEILSPASALDLGCGSGVLAFAMEKIWPGAMIIATDMDEVAIRVAEENAEKNEIKNISFAVADGFDHPALKGKTFEVITANILAEPLIELAPEVCAHLAPGGTVILSGLLKDQKKEVLNAYENQGLNLKDEFPENDWVALVLKKS